MVLIFIFESPSNKGRENKSPVMNCELILPGRLNSPGFSIPFTIIFNSFSTLLYLIPCSLNISKYVSNGLFPKFPFPINLVIPSNNKDIGIINLKVEPDSLQSMYLTAFLTASSLYIPLIITLSLSLFITAPNATIASIVALISSE